jgi:hypothetical protein
MKTIFLHYIILVISALLNFELQAQEIIAVAGGTGYGSGGSVGYSVGQVFYQNQSGSKGALAEGVLHPYFISTIQTTTGTEEINLSVLAYPNPTMDLLNLELGNFDNANMEYIVYDLHGKTLQQAKIIGTKTSIEMIHLVPSIYIVNLVKDNHLIKSFKVIKN